MSGLRTRRRSREQARDEQADRVGDPVPVGQVVGLGLGVAEDGREVDHQERDEDVVQEQEHADGQRRAGRCRPATSASSGSRPAARARCPRRAASISARSRIDTINWSRSRGDSSRSPIAAIAKTTRPTMPATRNWNCQSGWLVERVAGDLGDQQLPSTGPIVQNAIALARPICGEKSRISAGVATSAMPSTMLTSAKNTVYSALLVALGSAKQRQQPGQQQPADDEVRAAPAVRQPGAQRGERADQVADHQHEDELREREAEVLDDLRRDRALDVELVVQDDGRQDRDPQVRRPAARCPGSAPAAG